MTVKDIEHSLSQRNLARKPHACRHQCFRLLEGCGSIEVLESFGGWGIKLALCLVMRRTGAGHRISGEILLAFQLWTDGKPSAALNTRLLVTVMILKPLCR